MNHARTNRKLVTALGAAVLIMLTGACSRSITDGGPRPSASPTTGDFQLTGRWDGSFHGVGDILQPIASGAIKEADVLGDLYDLAVGTIEGRLHAEDITFFKNAGGGHLDLMTCEAVFQQLGKELA